MNYVVVVQNEKPRLPSWNTFYGGTHYHTRSRIKKTWAEIMRSAILEKGAVMFDERVDISITAFYKGRVPDSDNICAKVIIDPLIGLVIREDDSSVVRRVILEARHDKANPRIVVEVSAIQKE
jgi:hypothetical protein